MLNKNEINKTLKDFEIIQSKLNKIQSKTVEIINIFSKEIFIEYFKDALDKTLNKNLEERTLKTFVSTLLHLSVNSQYYHKDIYRKLLLLSVTKTQPIISLMEKSTKAEINTVLSTDKNFEDYIITMSYGINILNLLSNIFQFSRDEIINNILKNISLTDEVQQKLKTLYNNTKKELENI